MRQKVADFLEVNGEILQGVIDASPDDGLSSREHIAQLRCNDVYAREDAILAITEIHRSEVFCLQCRR